MSDNTGNYTSVARFLIELANAGKASKSKVALANEAANGSNFDYDVTGTPAPALGDYLIVEDTVGRVVGLPAGKVTVDAELDNGIAILVKCDYEPFELDNFIKEAMDFIDRHTRQWFNRREFTDANPVMIEGNNSPMLPFPVPILEIYSIQKYTTSEVLDPMFYQVFNGRALPDDRRCPMIKLRQSDDDVLFVGTTWWMRGVKAKITGAFGFLEPDGSTPKMIQRATLKLAIMRAVKSVGEAAKVTAAQQGLGAIKREKTDLHEIEYYDPNSAGGKESVNNGSGLSGDDEVDDIIAAYKGPILVDGTSPDFGIEAPYLGSLRGSDSNNW